VNGSGPAEGFGLVTRRRLAMRLMLAMARTAQALLLADGSRLAEGLLLADGPKLATGPGRRVTRDWLRGLGW
jgi:hypothetical protein